jgi:chromosome segregation ATPase
MHTVKPICFNGRCRSGKSNILDAICFVLGITNLSQVRASNLQELVYKQGQAGVTKATVSIVFDNADAAASPIGYEHFEAITVTRTVRNPDAVLQRCCVLPGQSIVARG